MTRTDHLGVTVRRSAQEAALRELYGALRGGYEALRHAHHVLAPFAFPQVSRLRAGPKQATRWDTQYRLLFGWNDMDERPAHGLEPSVPLTQQQAKQLRGDLRAHLNNLLRLKEENRRLCEEVARLVGQRRAEPRRPCS